MLQAKLHVLPKTGYSATINYPNGAKYCGELTLRNIRNGRGTLYMPNGIVRDGMWMNGRLHGTASIRKRISDRCYHHIYVGEFMAGMKHGEGKQLYAAGTYNGEWKDDKRTGLGIMWYKSGAIYVGSWRENHFHGVGTMVYGKYCFFFVWQVLYSFSNRRKSRPL